MEAGHNEPQPFDIVHLLLFGGRSIVSGNESVTFAPEIGYSEENGNNGDNNDPNHQIKFL